MVSDQASSCPIVVIDGMTAIRSMPLTSANGPKVPIWDVLSSVALEGKADISRRLPNNHDFVACSTALLSVLSGLGIYAPHAPPTENPRLA